MTISEYKTYKKLNELIEDSLAVDLVDLVEEEKTEEIFIGDLQEQVSMTEEFVNALEITNVTKPVQGLHGVNCENCGGRWIVNTKYAVVPTECGRCGDDVSVEKL